MSDYSGEGEGVEEGEVEVGGGGEARVQKRLGLANKQANATRSLPNGFADGRTASTCVASFLLALPMQPAFISICYPALGLVRDQMLSTDPVACNTK